MPGCQVSAIYGIHSPQWSDVIRPPPLKLPAPPPEPVGPDGGPVQVRLVRVNSVTGWAGLVAPLDIGSGDLPIAIHRINSRF